MRSVAATGTTKYASRGYLSVPGDERYCQRDCRACRGYGVHRRAVHPFEVIVPGEGRVDDDQRHRDAHREEEQREQTQPGVETRRFGIRGCAQSEPPNGGPDSMLDCKTPICKDIYLITGKFPLIP